MKINHSVWKMAAVTIAILSCFSCSGPNRLDPIVTLRKNLNLNVTSVTLYGNVAEKPREVTLTNNETMLYVASSLRNADEMVVTGTWVCRARINFSNGKMSDVKLVLGKKDGAWQFMNIGVETGYLKDEKFYVITFSDPKPQEFVSGLRWITGEQSY